VPPHGLCHIDSLINGMSHRNPIELKSLYEHPIFFDMRNISDQGFALLAINLA
jgi:hypothetical protein